MAAPKKPNTTAANEARRRDPYKRVLVTMDCELLADLDKAAARREMTRSQLLEYAATKMLMDEEEDFGLKLPKNHGGPKGRPASS